VGFESTDCPLGLVAEMHIQWDHLVLAVQFAGDAVDVRSAGFVAKYLRVDLDIPCLEPFYDDVVGSDTMMVSFGLEGLDKDSIGSVVVF